jgi:hypothetical protein
VADRNDADKLLSFPAPAPVPGSSFEDWNRRMIEIRDNLVSALEFLRITYNETLAGKPVKAADEILAQVVAILRNDERVPSYTVVGPSGFMDQRRQKQNETSSRSFPRFDAILIADSLWTTPNWKRSTTRAGDTPCGMAPERFRRKRY